MTIELEARDPTRNRHRRRAVDAGPDLFGHWNALVTYGRIGRAGRTLRRDFANESETLAFVRACLRRRGTARRRLAMAYRVIDASLSAQALIQLVGLEVAPPMPATPCSSAWGFKPKPSLAYDPTPSEA